MGLPEIVIDFKTKAASIIQRSERGIVALILKDSTNTTFDTKVYTSIDEINASDWTTKNKDYIEKTFLGVPSKIIVERIDADATDYNAALQRLANKKWNYLAIPGIEQSDVANISTWIKTQRDTNKKTFKAVLPKIAADHEGIINFCTENMKVGSTTYSASEYTCRIAGILAGLPLSRSATYYVLPEVESIQESTDPDADIDAGKLILINDGEKVKIARAVNSFVSTTTEKSDEFKKIKIIEGLDLVRDDIRETFEDNYVGKVINNYDNKLIFISSLNSYFKTLAAENVLDSSFNNKAEIDIEGQKTYLQSKGQDVSKMSVTEILKANTGSKLFISARVKFVDAMEDLRLTVYM